MPEDHRRLTRADLPEEFTPESVRQLPMATLRRLAHSGNGILDAEEQKAFDAVLHEVLSDTAHRVSRQIDRPDWATVMRDASARRSERGARASDRRVDAQLSRLARRLNQQVGAVEDLAPGVDWSFAQAGSTSPGPASAASSAGSETASSETDTVADLEQRLTEQVELVQVMSEIAEVSKRTYALEQQRDLQETRTVFFGFVVSVAVLVAGWAPLVVAEDWTERLWVIGLTVATCVVAGLVYALVRRRQNRLQEDDVVDSADVEAEA